MIYALFSNHWRRLDWTLIQVIAGMNCSSCTHYVNTAQPIQFDCQRQKLYVVEPTLDKLFQFPAIFLNSVYFSFNMATCVKLKC